MANERGTVHRASEKASSRCLRRTHPLLGRRYAAKAPASAMANERGTELRASEKAPAAACG